MKLRYDHEAKCAYVDIKDGEFARTEELVDGQVLIDRDKEGEILGIEFISLNLEEVGDKDFVEEMIGEFSKEDKTFPNRLKTAQENNNSQK